MNDAASAAIAVTAMMSLCVSCADSTAGPVGEPNPRPAPNTVIDWNEPADRVVFAETGWAIHACEGEAPLLCVEHFARPVGVIEANGYDVEDFDDLDPAAATRENLEAFARGFFQSLVDDRAAGCGSDYLFEPIEPTEFTFAGWPGLSFGFEGSWPDGKPSELNLQYAAIVDGRIISITAIAYDEDGCPGRDELSGFTSGELAEFRRHLEQVLRASPLPAVPV